MELATNRDYFEPLFLVATEIKIVDGVIEPFEFSLFTVNGHESYKSGVCLVEDLVTNRQVMVEGAKKIVDIPLPFVCDIVYRRKYVPSPIYKQIVRNLPFRDGLIPYGFWNIYDGVSDYLKNSGGSSTKMGVAISLQDYFKVIGLPFVPITPKYDEHCLIGMFKNVFINLKYGAPILSSLYFDAKEIYLHTSRKFMSTNNLKRIFWEPLVGKMTFYDECDVYLAYADNSEDFYAQAIEAFKVLNSDGVFVYYLNKTAPNKNFLGLKLPRGAGKIDRKALKTRINS